MVDDRSDEATRDMDAQVMERLRSVHDEDDLALVQELVRDFDHLEATPDTVEAFGAVVELSHRFFGTDPVTETEDYMHLTDADVTVILAERDSVADDELSELVDHLLFGVDEREAMVETTRPMGSVLEAIGRWSDTDSAPVPSSFHRAA